MGPVEYEVCVRWARLIWCKLASTALLRHVWLKEQVVFLTFFDWSPGNFQFWELLFKDFSKLFSNKSLIFVGFFLLLFFFFIGLISFFLSLYPNRSCLGDGFNGFPRNSRLHGPTFWVLHSDSLLSPFTLSARKEFHIKNYSVKLKKKPRD